VKQGERGIQVFARLVAESRKRSSATRLICRPTSVQRDLTLFAPISRMSIEYGEVDWLCKCSKR
jgi:hypothetical protein